ncbi:HIT family protein [archaeon]|nr:HIT family protein [archaeon]
MENKKNVLFEGDKVIALLHPKPASIGHIIVLPKKHATIIEEVPDYVLPELFSVANKLSLTVFESLGVHGTNLLIQNGIPAGQKHTHMMLHVIPRQQNDGLNLMWQPKQGDDEQLTKIALQLEENSKRIGIFEEEPSAPKEVKATEELSEEDAYLKKALRRRP